MKGEKMKFLAFVSLVIVPALASAEEIKVLSGGAAKSFVDPLAAAYAQHAVKLEYQPMGKLVQTLASGAPVDMVIVTSEVYERLGREGKLPQGSGKPLARVGIGVAVNEKAPLPDISTPEAFRRTLLAAKSVVYIDPKTGSSGKHVAEVLSRLGISEEVNRKTTLGQGGYVTEPVGRGEIELGIHQISEILPVKGVRLVGPLPAELQKYTVYVAVPAPGTVKSQAVSDLIAYLSGPQARERLAAAGYTAPE
jgi:molybdate transport system substrate-binding protein